MTAAPLMLTTSIEPAALDSLLDQLEERLAERLADRLSPTTSSPWLTVKEAADYLRTSEGAIYKRIKRGQLPSYRPEGSSILLRREDLAGTGPQRRGVL